MIKSNLPVLLAERRLKVADLIRMTDISKSTMHKIYNDQTTRIDFDTMDRICEALEVNVGVFLNMYLIQKRQRKKFRPDFL